MPSKQCLDNIKKENPPVCCDEIESGWCERFQEKINQYCRHVSAPPDTPVPMQVNGSMCWCCCGWYPDTATPVEVERGLYRLLEEVERGQDVLTTDTSVSGWVAGTVTEVGDVAPGSVIGLMAHAEFQLADGQARSLITTPEHLFLRPDGTLTPTMDLRPGDEVRQADGGLARVQLVSWLEFGGGIRHIALGRWRQGEPLDGHLINANGLVIADLAVQLEYYGAAGR
jgi:hypothetical protein